MKKTAGRLIAAVLITALIFGGIYAGLRSYRASSAKPVKVVSVSSAIYPSEYFTEEGQQAYGSVKLDRMQTVYVSSTQKVNEIQVKEGQEVKRGDVLLTYDTTLTAIQIEKAENELLQLKLSLERAEEDVRRANMLSPSSGDDGDGSVADADLEEPEKEPKPEKPKKLKAEETPLRLSGSGTKSNPYIYLWGKRDSLTNETLLLMFRPNDYEEPGEAASEETDPSGIVGFILRGSGILPLSVYAEESPDDEVPDEGSEVEVEEGTEADADAEEEPDEGTEEGIEESFPETEDPSEAGSVEEGVESTPVDDEEETETSAPVVTAEDTETPYVDLTGCPNEVWVILETHENDNRDGDIISRFGLHLIRDEQDVACILFNPDSSGVAQEGDDADDEELGELDDIDEDDEEDLDDEEEIDLPVYGDSDGEYEDDDADEEEESVSISRYESDIDLDAAYTRAEIEELKKTKAKELRDLTLDFKMAELNLREMKAEAGDGTVKAKLNGVVKTVRDPTEAYQNNEPVVTVSGGGGYTISISVSELDYKALSVGQEVEITSFENEEEEITGSIKSISDYPGGGSDSWFGGNPNVSYYPCVVYVDGDAELREYDYVSVNYGGGSVDDSMYIEKMFVRSDAAGSFVYVMDEEGILRRRNISTGKQPDSSVIEIRGGLSEDDYIAFPYGTGVFDGAKTQIASVDELYE